MRNLVTTVLIAGLWAGAAEAVEGTWKGRAVEGRSREVYLGLTYARTSNMGTNYDLRALTGLDTGAINATSSTPVTFSLQREAGRVVFEGSFREGKGSGVFTFEPDRGYFDRIRALGVDTSRRKYSGGPRSTDEDLLFLALNDVSTDYIRGMIAEGYELTLGEYQNMRIFAVTPDYIREMRSIFGTLSSEELVNTRIHGVTPDYVREMRAAGWDLSLREYQNARIFDVTPEFREEMSRLGYRLSLRKLTDFRIHGVTPEWIAELKSLGYDRLSAEDLVSTRIFQVTPEFIKSVEDAGYRNLPMRELISMRVHGVSPRDLSRKRAI